MFHHHLMAGPCELIVAADPVLFGPLPGELYDVGLMQVGGRRVVVGNDYHLVRVPHVHPHFPKAVVDLQTRPQDVVHHRPVNVHPQDVIRVDVFISRGPGHNFFRNCISHTCLVSLYYINNPYTPVMPKSAITITPPMDTANSWMNSLERSSSVGLAIWV